MGEEGPHGTRARRGLTYAEHSSRSTLSNDVYSSTPPREMVRRASVTHGAYVTHCQSWLLAVGGPPGPSPSTYECGNGRETAAYPGPRGRLGPRGNPTRLKPFPLPPLSLFPLPCRDINSRWEFSWRVLVKFPESTCHPPLFASSSKNMQPTAIEYYFLSSVCTYVRMYVSVCARARARVNLCAFA